MATSYTAGLRPSNNTDALFRLWCVFIRDTFLAGGWAQTADTGQIDFATVTKPAGSNQARGYAIFIMGDTLQATAPVYVRLDFGSGGSADTPGLWISLGSGTDGAGTLNPAWFVSSTASSPTLFTLSNSTSQDAYTFGSADTNRISVGMWATFSSTNFTFMFSIERTKAANGEDTDEGAIFMYGISSLTTTRYLFAEPRLQPSTETAAYLLSSNNPTALSEEVGGSPIYPFASLVKQPGTGFMTIRKSDWLASSRIRVLYYDELVTYQRLLDLVQVSSDANAALYMRFD